jgi:hypothetical protein
MNTCLSYAVLLALGASGGAIFVSARMPQKAAANENRAAEEVRQVNAGEVEAFLHKDLKTMARLWSEDFVGTNPLNRFVTKQQDRAGAAPGRRKPEFRPTLPCPVRP